MQWHRLQHLIWVAWVVVCALCTTSNSRAQSVPVAAPEVGQTGLPGLWRAASPRPREPHLQTSGHLEYGYTEGHSAAPGDHHRLGARLSLAARPLPWLAASATTKFRHDRHVADNLGDDQGTTLDSLITLLAGTSVTPQLHWGGLLQARFGDAGDIGLSLSNPTVDALVLAEYRPAGAAYQLLGAIGYRLDLSGNTVGDPIRYRPGDRLALGVSDFDAIPLTLGGRYHWGETSALLELAGNFAIGDGAPEPLQSPLWLTVGVNRAISRNLSWSLLLDTSLSSRREPSQALVHYPVTPRVRVVAGLSMNFGKVPEVAPRPPPLVKPPPVKKEIPKTNLVVNVRSPQGDPLSDAQVVIVRDAKSWPVAHVNLEKYAVEAIPSGSVVLRVQADRLRSAERTVELVGAEVVVDVQLQLAGSTGQIRGVVRSFSGGGLQARIRIEPLGEKRVTSATGSFEIEVPPGRYEVVMEADGHRAQRRSVVVTADGVVVLNADLRRGMP